LLNVSFRSTELQTPFTDEDRRLKTLITSIPESIGEQLTALIERDDGITALNIIRADQKDFQYTAVKAEVDKALRLKDLYNFTKIFIPSLKLSKNAVRYYADITEQCSGLLNLAT